MNIDLSEGDYYIVVEGYAGGTGSFDLLVQDSSLSFTQSSWEDNLNTDSEKSSIW